MAKTDKPLQIGAQPSRVKMDFMTALRAAKVMNPAIGDPQDYYLASMIFGWEFVGYYNFAGSFSKVSLVGTPAIVSSR